MASNGKKKTTMAKLQREQRMREKRLDKKMRREARKDEVTEVAPEIEPEFFAARTAGREGFEDDSAFEPAPR